VISLCETAKDEVIASRALIAQYETTLRDQEREQTLTESELASVRDALDKEKKALGQSELAVKEYKKALAKEVKKKNFYKRIATSTTLTTIILAALLFL
jgi:hypothetical protein